MLKLHIDSSELSKKVCLPRGFKKLVKEIGITEKKKLGEICIIFVTAERILQINEKYLSHNYVTDVITFDNSVKGIVKGDIFICLQEVFLNAQRFQTIEHIELLRVMIHGILHLCGFVDKTESERKVMRIKEDYFLLTAEGLKIDDINEFKL